jgi:hypothetical protein
MDFDESITKDKIEQFILYYKNRITSNNEYILVESLQHNCDTRTDGII